MSDQNTDKLEDNRTLAQLKEELVAREFIGAETLTTKAQATSILTALDKKDAEALKNRSANTPTVIDPVKDNERVDTKKYESKAARMKAHLMAQEQVSFLIPLGIGEKKGAIETWQANGYKLSIMKGVLVKVPKQVAESLAESYQLTAEAGSKFLADRPSTDPNAPFKTVRDALE